MGLRGVAPVAMGSGLSVYYTILYYTILDDTLLYYTVSYFGILYYTLLYYSLPTFIEDPPTQI